jgi:hypothetical protein
MPSSFKENSYSAAQGEMVSFLRCSRGLRAAQTPKSRIDLCISEMLSL